jgi:hypothetical protein
MVLRITPEVISFVFGQTIENWAILGTVLTIDKRQASPAS